MPKAAEKRKTVYFCQECGNESSKWMGFCPSPLCNSPRPLTEIAAAPAAPSPRRAGWVADDRRGEALPLDTLSADSQPRIPLPSSELNRVLGGGVVPGSVTLLTGEPGVGKSTLLLQLAHSLAPGASPSSPAAPRPVMYVTGEESPMQVKLRSQRLGIGGQGILVMTETEVDAILERLDDTPPALVIIDSIQTLHCETESSGPGSVGQVRECGLRLLRWAKARGTPVFLSGHMTKDGAVAGPRVLEHMVDAVLHLEPQESGAFRVLRATKNRFGSTGETGVFQMTGQGLTDVPDPSSTLLPRRDGAPPVGAIITAALEGSRVLLLEVQALTNFSQLPAPRRVANGVDHNRLIMLTAVATRRAGLELAGQDVIVNVAGGFRATEPAADLAVILAVASCYRNAPLFPAAAFGEVGLSAELRPVPQTQRRVNEAARLGLTRCILPTAAIPDLEAPPGMKLIAAETVTAAIRVALAPPAGQLDRLLSDDPALAKPGKPRRN